MTSMTMDAPAQSSTKTKAPPMPRHGVDTPKLFATIDAVKGQPELAQFQFRATSRWIKGTHSRSTMAGFAGAGGEHQHVAAFKADADHPAVLCGGDNGPTPVEYLLAGLDMARLVDHQAKFVAQVMGGPASYTDEQLQRVHTALGITRAESAEMSMLLEEERGI